MIELLVEEIVRKMDEVFVDEIKTTGEIEEQTCDSFFFDVCIL